MILIAKHLDRDLTTLGNKLSSLINPIRIVWVEMWFNLETLLKSCLCNDVRTTTPIHHQFIVLLMYNIGVEHTGPTSILITNSYVM